MSKTLTPAQFKTLYRILAKIHNREHLTEQDCHDARDIPLFEFTDATHTQSCTSWRVVGMVRITATTSA